MRAYRQTWAGRQAGSPPEGFSLDKECTEKKEKKTTTKKKKKKRQLKVIKTQFDSLQI